MQYDFKGNYVDKHSDIGSAAEKVGVSATSISKVLRGLRNSSAGYIWKKVDAGNDIPSKIDVNFDVSKTSSGVAKRIVMMEDNGQVKQEYDSIAETARETGIS